jgi:5'-3' exonuclease
MSDILVCDGSNLFVRAFFSMTDTTLQNSKSQDTTAIYVFLQHLRKMITTEKPEECYIIFDFGRDIRKKGLYKDYKANRNIDLGALAGYDLTVKMNEIESRKRQKEVIIDALKTLPVKLVIVKQIEGDCLIAFVAKHFIDRGKTVTVVSNDKDFYQLLDHDNMKIFNPHKKQYIASCNMEEIFPIKNFPISSYRVYKAIRGDSSDNIPGIKLFGDKKIQQLFDMLRDCDPGKQAPRTIQELYDDFEKCPKAKAKFWKYFDGQKELLELNYKLVDLVDMDWSPQSLQLIYAAIESKPSFSAMDFMQILIRENINTILAKVQDWMKPFHQMLPEKK